MARNLFHTQDNVPHVYTSPQTYASDNMAAIDQRWQRSENSDAHVWSEAGLNWYRTALDTCCKSQECTHNKHPQGENVELKPMLSLKMYKHQNSNMSAEVQYNAESFPAFKIEGEVGP